MFLKQGIGFSLSFRMFVNIYVPKLILGAVPRNYENWDVCKNWGIEEKILA